MKSLDEIEDYLYENGFDFAEYGSRVFWHHDACADILNLDENGLCVYSLPSDIDITTIGLKCINGNYYITSIEDVDKLLKVLI
jgi:hypothetical protein